VAVWTRASGSGRGAGRHIRHGNCSELFATMRKRMAPPRRRRAREQLAGTGSSRLRRRAMRHVLVYGDSLSWGIVPDTRQRLPFDARWPGVMERDLASAGHRVRVVEDCLNGRRTVWEDPFKPGRRGLDGIEQRVEVSSPLALVILLLGTNDFQAVHRYN